MQTDYSVHPLRSKAKILLSSVFGPYSRNDEYGSRKACPMEIYRAEVASTHGPFNPRSFQRSFGLMLIQANISAPCVLLDFPTLERFEDEIKNNRYDIIGIGSVMLNAKKVKVMCDLVRKYQPDAIIVVGSHVANMTGIEEYLGADYIVKGDGVSWFRRFLGEDEFAPIKHPPTFYAFGGSFLGIKFSDKYMPALVIPSAGCPVGCNFCGISSFFGGKGKYVNFYETGDELFNVMCWFEEKFKTKYFNILDDNFLLHKKRALRLLELMKEHNKIWSLNVFGSVNAVKMYKMEELIRMGILWLWIGVESKDSNYEKMGGVDTHSLFKELRENGIRVAGSSIIGLEHHTLENIDEVIEWSATHETDFHQYMLCMIFSGTELFSELEKEGRILKGKELQDADKNLDYHFYFKHKHIPAGKEEELVFRAYRRDFAVQGPMLARVIRTTLNGWNKYKNHPDECIRDRFRVEFKMHLWYYLASVWAMKKWYKEDKALCEKMSKLFSDLKKESNPLYLLLAPILGSVLYSAIKNEFKRSKDDPVFEPPIFYEKNEAARAVECKDE